MLGFVEQCFVQFSKGIALCGRVMWRCSHEKHSIVEVLSSYELHREV